MRPGALPPVAVLDITTRDVTGDLIGRPAEWLDDLGVAPAVTIRQPSVGKSAGKAPVAGLGDRVLAKIFPAKDRGGPAYTARVIKILDKRKNAGMGVFRAMPDGGGRILPIDKRGEELAVDSDFTAGAKDGDLVEIDVLVLQRMRHLVRERAADLRRQLRAPHRDPFGLGVVERRRAFARQLVLLVEEVEVARHEPHRPQRSLAVIDGLAVLVGQLRLRGRHLGGELLVREEVDVDRVLEQHAPRRRH